MRNSMLAVGSVALAIAAGWVWAHTTAPAPNQADPAPPATAPATTTYTSDLDYWLDHATDANATDTRAPAAIIDPEKKRPADPANPAAPAGRDDALPGVIRTSNGTVLPGWLYTTRDKPWQVWVQKEKRWRHVPFLTVLSISATNVQPRMELKWRWKEMAVPEKIYTGEKYPTVSMQWRFRLIDGSEIVGDVKGQPLWVSLGGRRVGPLVLHENLRGTTTQTLDDLVYPEKIIISRRLMRAVLADRAKAAKATPPARPARTAK